MSGDRRKYKNLIKRSEMKNFNEMSEKELEMVMSGIGVSNNSKGGGRKEEVLGLLKLGVWSVKELSVKVGVSSRNISSVICYLRDDGIEIRKMNRGSDIGLVLWSKIVGGKKVGNRVELDKGKVVRFNFKEGKFEDEVVKEEVKKEVKT